MDQCVKLAKLIKDNNIEQFSAHLGHCKGRLNQNHLNILLFQIFAIQSANHAAYLNEILKLQAPLNQFWKSKDRLVEFYGKNPLMVACQCSNFQSVSALLNHKRAKLELVDSLKQNILFYALRNQSEEESYQIIRSIVSINQKLINAVNADGNSVLFTALEKKSLRIIQLLLKNQADPNFKCQKTGDTSLHKSLSNNTMSLDKKKDLVLLLLNFNADPLIENNQNKSAFDIAKEVGLEMDWLDEHNQESYEQSSQQVKVCHKEINSMTKQDENSVMESENISMSFESEDSDQPFTVENLSQQILTFAKNCQKKHIDSWKDIQTIYNELANIGNYFNLKIDIIGSYATGLWTPNSDIDIAFTNNDSNYIQIEDMLSKIFQLLRQKSVQLGIKQIYLNKNNNGLCFPNIKIDLQPKYHNRKIDITIFQKKNNGQKYVRFVRQKLTQNLLIRPVFFTLQRLLKSFGLANPSKNGLKTYAIFLILLISYDALKTQSIGQYFINTIYYFAYCFPYQETLNQEGELEYKINIYDPLNNYNNVGGRKTDVNKLRQMFRVCDYGLRLAGGKNVLEYLFSLCNIFIK